MRQKLKPMTIQEARNIVKAVADGTMDKNSPAAWMTQTDAASLLDCLATRSIAWLRTGSLTMSRRGTSRGFYVHVSTVMAILDAESDPA